MGKTVMLSGVFAWRADYLYYIGEKVSELTSKSAGNQYIPGCEQPPQKKFTINVQNIDGKDLLVIGKIRICTKLHVRNEWKYESVCTLQYTN